MLDATDIQQAVWRVIGEVLAERNRPVGERDGRRGLFADGVGLDSLDFAVVVVRLEQATGRDPFRTGAVQRPPRTVGELIDLYREAGGGA